MSRRSPASAIIIYLCVVPTHTVHAQSARDPAVPIHSIRIDGARASCTTCRITLSPIATHGDSSGPGRLGADLYAVARDTRGYLLVASAGVPGVAIHDVNGAFLRRLEPPTNGLSAEDTSRRYPSAIGFVAVSRDTALLIDDANHVATVYKLDRAGETLVSRYQMPPYPGGSWFALALSNGALVVAGEVPDRSHVGYPLHVIGRDGSIQRSFGSDDQTVMPDVDPSVRVLAPAGLNALWAGFFTRYRLERITAAGATTMRIDRRVPWFTPHVTFKSITPTQPPQPQLMAVREDEAGRLWTIVRVADPAWRGAVSAAPARGGHKRYQASDTDRLFDSWIEVLDPVCRRVIASRRVQQSLDRFIGADQVVGWRADPGAAPSLDVWRVGLTVPPMEDVSCSRSASRPSLP